MTLRAWHLALALLLPWWAQAQESSTAAVLAVSGGRIIDGWGGTPVEAGVDRLHHVFTADALSDYSDEDIRLLVRGERPAGTGPMANILRGPYIVPTIEMRQAYARAASFPELQAATLRPAQMQGVLDKLGTLSPGKLADLVVVDGDPLQDLSVIEHRLVLVVKDGVPHEIERTSVNMQ